MKRLLAILALAAPAASAHCVMCFRTAASQILARHRVMNMGIGVMLVPPVLILAGFLYLAYRRNLSFADRDTPRPAKVENLDNARTAQKAEC